MAGQLAARVDDQVGAHAAAGSGFRILESAIEFAAIGAVAAGLVVAAVAAAPVVLAGVTAGAAIGATAAAAGGAALGSLAGFGGAAALVGGALSGAAQGIGAQRKEESGKVGGGCSKITVGSGDVFIESKAAARAGTDKNSHSADALLKQGSATVFVNGKPLTRREDSSCCGGKVISSAQRTFVGGHPTESGASANASAAAGRAAGGGLDDVDWKAWEDGLGIAGLALGVGAIGAGAVNVVRNAGGIVNVLTTWSGAAKAALFSGEVGGGFYVGAKLHDAGDALGAMVGGTQGAVTGALIGEGLANAVGVSRLGGALGARLPKLGFPALRPLAEAPVRAPRESGCPSCGGGLGRRGMQRIGPRNSFQSQVLDGGSHVLKRVSNGYDKANLDGARTPYAARTVIARRLAEVHNRVADAIGHDVVPPLEPLDHKGGRASNWVRQAKAEGVPKYMLEGAAQFRAEREMNAYIAKARDAVGIAHDPRFHTVGKENGVSYHVDAMVEENFRFNPDGTVRSWFDPVAVYPTDDPAAMVANADRPLRFGEPEPAPRPHIPEDWNTPQAQDDVAALDHYLEGVKPPAEAPPPARWGKTGFVAGDDGAPTVFRHYTDAAGFAAFQKSGVIKANDDNVVFLTKDALTPEEAFNNLFIANPRYAGKGEYVVELHVREGAQLATGKNDELHHVGSLREGRHIEVVRAGKNVFGTAIAGKKSGFRAYADREAQIRTEALARASEGCPACNAASKAPSAKEATAPPPADPAIALSAKQKKLRGASDAAIDPDKPAGFVAPADAVNVVKNAWQKVLRFERRNNDGQPLADETRAALFDGFMSRNLTRFGPERATRKDGHRLFMLDDPFLAKADVPDFIKQRVTIDHHDALFTTAKGPVETTGMQILARASAGDPRLFSDGKAQIRWSSGNVNDGASDASFFLKNADRFAANPEATRRALEVSNWIDNKNFMKEPLLAADAAPGSDTEAALAVMRVNDRMTKSIGTKAADRIAVPSPDGGVIDMVPTANVEAALPDAHAQLERIFFDASPAGQAERTRLANEHRATLKEALKSVDEGMVDIGDHGGAPSGVLFYDSTALNAKNLGQLAAWRVVPEKAMKLEAETPGRTMVRSIDFADAGADDVGPKTKYFIGTLGAKQSLEPLVPLMRQAEVDARVKRLAEVKDDPNKVEVLEREIKALQAGGGAVASKLPGLVFAPGGSRMSKADMIAFVRRPEVRAILEGKPAADAPAAPEKEPFCAACAAAKSTPRDSRRAVGHEPVPDAIRNATPEDVARWKAEGGPEWEAYKKASWASRSKSPLPERAQRNPEIVRTFDTPDGPYTQVRLAGRQNLDPANNVIKPLPGVTDVIIHGNGSSGVKGFQVERFPGRREVHDLKEAGAPLNAWQTRISQIDPADGGQRIEPEHLAEVLRRMGIEGDVRLVSCYGAKDTTDAGAAARFAKAWSQNGERVYAYPGAVQNDTVTGAIFTPRHVIDPFTGEPVLNENTMLPVVRQGDPGLTAFDVKDGKVVVSNPTPEEAAARSVDAPRRP